MRRSIIFSLFIIIIAFAIGAYFYPKMPDLMPMHWNAQGEIDAYWPKEFGLFFMPVLTLGLLGLFIGLPKIDPLRKNIEKFRYYYQGFMVVFVLFMFYLYVLSISSVWFSFSIIQALAPAFGLLFFYIGVLLEKSKRNWFIGFRTPWTLSSDKVWEATHKRGGMLFKICGIIALAGVFFPDHAIWLVVAPVIITAIYTFVFSYFEYKKTGK